MAACIGACLMTRWSALFSRQRVITQSPDWSRRAALKWGVVYPKHSRSAFRQEKEARFSFHVLYTAGFVLFSVSIYLNLQVPL